MKIKKIDFVSKDKIDEKAHELVWRLFGIEGAIITNKSLLEDFIDFEDIPGHTLRRFSTLPREDQEKYKKQNENLDKDILRDLLVWYPFLTEEERENIERKTREDLAEMVATEYGIVIPEILSGETRIWKIAKHILQRQKHSLRRKRAIPNN